MTDGYDGDLGNGVAVEFLTTYESPDDPNLAGFGSVLAIPTENGPALDAINAGLRASPGWRRFMVARFGNVSTDPLDPFPPAVLHLSTSQREDLRNDLIRAGFVFPNGMEIDPAGNFNQNQGFWAHWYYWAPAAAAAALVTMGAAGYGPLAAALGQSTAGAAVLPSSSLVTGAPISSGLFAAPAAITSQGVSASLGLLPSASIAGVFGASAPAIVSQGVSEGVGLAVLPSSAIAAATGSAAPALSSGAVSAGVAATGGAGALLNQLDDWIKAGLTVAPVVAGVVRGPGGTPAPAPVETLTGGIGDVSPLLLVAALAVAVVLLK